MPSEPAARKSVQTASTVTRRQRHSAFAEAGQCLVYVLGERAVTALEEPAPRPGLSTGLHEGGNGLADQLGLRRPDAAAIRRSDRFSFAGRETVIWLTDMSCHQSIYPLYAPGKNRAGLAPATE
jgi:hypothetical protein